MYLHTTRNFIKSTTAKWIVNSFIVSISLGKLTVVQVTLLNPR